MSPAFITLFNVVSLCGLLTGEVLCSNECKLDKKNECKTRNLYVEAAKNGQDKPADVPKVWITMKKTCIDSMRTQVQAELHASLQYLAMAAHFSRDVINRPGFAKMFFESASEERDHSIKLIKYLSMRGDLTSNVSSLITMPKVEKTEWATGVDALKDALKLEAKVTNLIRGVISDCENSDEFNDYHLVDYLTGDFLEEQYKGQRQLAGHVSTLDKMMESHGALGEFLFDKKLLAGEV